MKKLMIIAMISCFSFVALASTSSPPVKFDKCKIEKSIICDQACSAAATDIVVPAIYVDVFPAQNFENFAITAVSDSSGSPGGAERLCKGDGVLHSYAWLMESNSGYSNYDLRQCKSASRPNGIPIDVAWLRKAHDKS